MRGWVMVAGEQLNDKELRRWIKQAQMYVATLPAK
jgi:hypothetical protein